MEYFNLAKTKDGFHVEDFPNAVKVIQINRPQSKKLADLFLHRNDLEFSLKSLEEINCVPDQSNFLRQALWRSAIVHYLKCFGDNKARFNLDSKKIYRKEEPIAIENFEYFRNLRNKHVVHDENSYSQSIPGAILNKQNHPYKIEKIVCFAITVETLTQENYSNLHMLIKVALTWIVSEFDGLCEILTKELESKSYETLIQMPNMKPRTPTIDEVKNNRLENKPHASG